MSVSNWPKILQTQNLGMDLQMVLKFFCLKRCCYTGIQAFFLKSGKMDLLDLFLDVSAISCFRGYYRSRRAASFTRLRPLSIFSDEAIFLASVRLRNYTEAHILLKSFFKKTSCFSLLLVVLRKSNPK